jgi:hypothetical protein
MKASSSIVLSLATAASVSLAAAQPSTDQEGYLDRTLPTYPEIATLADGYRFDAGESTHDMVVQDAGSA